MTKELIRAAGGIVHSDGNIFCTSIAQLDAYAKQAVQAVPISVAQYSSCSDTLRALGKSYPRTCALCGLGPCKTKPATPQPPAKQVPLTDAMSKLIDDFAFEAGKAAIASMENVDSRSPEGVIIKQGFNRAYAALEVAIEAAHNIHPAATHTTNPSGDHHG